MKRYLLLVLSSVALCLMMLGPSKALAGGVRVYVGPGHGYGYRYTYPRYRPGYYPRSSYDYPRGYHVYRVPRRYVRRRARRYWRGWY